ncbi:MAG: CPBP family intramembrane metalloprotease [Gammaproteobacteria bacterium]|nr:CPBP family intramembrane metalloprotease [Gammaproteobacteria bacterium]
MEWFDHLLVFVFAVIAPYHGWRNYPKFLDMVKRDPAATRRGLYLGNVAALWVITFLVMGVWLAAGRPPADLGLTPLTGLPAVISLALVLIIITIAVVFYQTVMRLDQKYNWTFVPELLPRSKQELNLFLVLSATAGITEEILFRGYLIWYLSQFGNVVFAVILSSLIFAVAHAYQGAKAIAVIFPVGLLFAFLYVYSGSLLAPMMLHAAINSYAGIYGRKVYGGNT